MGAHAKPGSREGDFAVPPAASGDATLRAVTGIAGTTGTTGDEVRDDERQPGGQWGAFLGRSLLFLGLTLLGNYLSLSVGFSVDFIFGSVFGLLAVVILGPVTGTVISVLGALYTLELWNHPYGMVIFGLEAAWLGIARARAPVISIVITDALYWVVLGVPLILLFYRGWMGMETTSVSLIMMKQAMNGITNAILASVILTFVPSWRWLKLPRLPERPFSQLVSESMAFLLLIACLSGLVYMNQRDLEQAQENLAQSTLKTGVEAEWFISDWLASHQLAPQYLAAKGEALGFRYSDELQQQVVEIHQLFPDFHNVFVGDAHATTVAFAPRVNEQGETTIGINFEDREWFHQLRAAQEPSLSDVFLGRGGIFEPIVTLTAPVVRDGELVGFGLGAVNLNRLEQFLRGAAEFSGMTLTILDRKRHLVLSTASDRKPMSDFDLPVSPGPPVLPGVFLSTPRGTESMPRVRNWKNAVLFSETPVASTGWTIVVEGPLSPLRDHLYRSTTLNLGMIFVLLIATSVLSVLLSKRLTHPVGQIAAISADLPQKIQAGTAIQWPKFNVQESAWLVSNFRKMAENLREKILALKAHGEDLESIVEERTKDLAESEHHLKEAQRLAHIGSWDLDLSTKRLHCSDEIHEILATDRERFRDYEDFLETVHPDDRATFEATYSRSVAAMTPYELTHRVLLANGTVKWIQNRGETHYADDGAAVRSFGTVQDITMQVTTEEQLATYARAQRALLMEVNHRVKNNLALITSMLNLEAKSNQDPVFLAAIERISGRVNALSRVHSMLSSTEWKPINIHDLCEAVVGSTFVGRPVLLAVAPSDIVVSTSQAHNLALVVNELATNSAKYTGDVERLEIRITIERVAQHIELRYQDSGPGYPEALLEGEPLRKGSGLQLIRGIVERSMYGSTEFHNDNGAAAVIRLPEVAEDDA